MARQNDLSLGRGGIVRLVTVLGYVVLLAPLATVIFFSFSASAQTTHWSGFSLQWYGKVLADDSLLPALRTSLQVALLSTAIATVLGTILAWSLDKRIFPGRGFIQALVTVPIILPEIILGVSLLMLFIFLSVPLGLFTVVMAHATFNIPFVSMIVAARLERCDKRLIEAGMDLGAGPWRSFRDIALPQLMPGIMAGALFAFTLSLDDFVVTLFVAGSSVTTLPLKLYTMIKNGMNPSINALSTLLVLVTFSMLLMMKALEQVSRLGKFGSWAVLALYLALGGAVLAWPDPDDDRPQLVFATWGDYIDPAIVEEFERENRCRVRLAFMDSTEQILTKLHIGSTGYDLVISNPALIQIMKNLGKLAPFDHARLPHWRELDTAFTRLPYDTSGLYYFPYAYGTSGIEYNREKVAEPIKSWRVMWDERYAGRILMFDEMTDVIGLGCRLEGGSITDRDTELLARALALLKKQKPLLRKYDCSTQRELMASGDAWLAMMWNGQAFRLAREDTRFAYVEPPEGTFFWVDNICLLADAPHKELAHKFIDFLCRPEIAARNMQFMFYAMPNPAARKLLPPDLRDNPILFTDATDTRNEVLLDLGPFNRDVERAWTELKGE